MTLFIPLLRKVPEIVEGDGALADRYGRVVTSLRISLNASALCNYRCVFCHMEGINENFETLMTPEEIARIVHVLTPFGIERVKLTGGEPMLRTDILTIVHMVKETGISELSMTTNGTRLRELAFKLKEEGLDRVNVSLHTLKPDRYREITKADKHAEVVEAIHTAVEAGLTPVKVNVTLMKGVNDDEIEDLIEFTASLGAEKATLQLIELIDSNREFYERFHLPLPEIESRLRGRSVKVVKRQMQGRNQYQLSNGVRVELVTPMDNCEFCSANNRMRVTYDGRFKPCLLREDNHVDFLTTMRNGASDAELIEIYKRAMWIREPYFRTPDLKPVAEIRRVKREEHANRTAE